MSTTDRDGDQSLSPVHELTAEITSNCAAGAVLEEVSKVLLNRVPADIWCAVMLDPSTLLDTGGVHTGGFSQEVMPRLFEIEHTEQIGVDNVRRLARRRDRVSVLSRSCGGDIERSVYYRDVLRPEGMADEMRVVLREGSRTWGLLCWCRADPVGFSAADLAAAAALATPATNALRAAFLLGGAEPAALPDAPGLLLMAADGTTTITPSAHDWLADIAEQGDRGGAGGDLPHVVQAVLGAARRSATTDPAFARTRGRSGRWITIRAWSTGPGALAVGLGPTDFGELVAIVLDAYGLTPRERDITQRVLRGASTAQIAEQLTMSPYTVQDHLKSIFAKTGVNSRRDLVATIFFKHYHPVLGQDPLTRDGRRMEA